MPGKNEPDFDSPDAELHCSDPKGEFLVHSRVSLWPRSPPFLGFKILMSRTQMPYRPPSSSTASESPSGPPLNGRLIIIAMVVLLLILHQDNWFWTDDRLVFGFMPMGMFWHVCISIGAAATWALATKIAWPVHEDSAASTPREGGQ